MTQQESKQNNSIEEFEKALRNFNELIRRGWTKSRGYNLQTINNETNLFTTKINTSKQG